MLTCRPEKGRWLVLLSSAATGGLLTWTLNSALLAVRLELCLTLEKTYAVKLRWLLPALQPALHSAIGKKFHGTAGQRQQLLSTSNAEELYEAVAAD